MAKPKTITIDANTFQILHSSARALFRTLVQSNNHSPHSLAATMALNDAIDIGHKVLGTERPAADQYVDLIGGVTRTQYQHAQHILDREGLLNPE